MIHIGTSGWNYPSGRGTWNGVFYPAKRGRGFDELRYYAEHFDTVEVNSTFYRMPEPALTRRWVERTPEGFVFAVKLYQKFTHPDMYLARDGVTNWDLSLGDIDAFRAGLGPLAEASRLGALLLQFPPSFHAQPETRDYLDWLLTAFADYPLAVELRHRTWSDDATGTRARLSAHRAAWVLIDEPKFKDSVQQGTPELQNPRTPEPDSGLTYVRFHGRNAAAWWNPAESEDRYDYLYSPSELAPFAAVARAATASGRRVLMFLNNHFSAKAVANAAVLKHALDLPVEGEYPREMIARYPDLSGIVKTGGLPL